MRGAVHESTIVSGCAGGGNGVKRTKEKEKVAAEEKSAMASRSHAEALGEPKKGTKRRSIPIEPDPARRRLDSGSVRNGPGSSAGNGVGRMKGKEKVLAESKHNMVLRSHAQIGDRKERKKGEEMGAAGEKNKMALGLHTGKRREPLMIGVDKKRMKGKEKVAVEKKNTVTLWSYGREQGKQHEKGVVKRTRAAEPDDAGIPEKKKPRAYTFGQFSGTDDFDCSICMETKQLTEGFNIKSCSHMFCASCMSQYIAAKVEENVTSVGCPDPSCKIGILEPEMCRLILPERVFNRWGVALCESALGMRRFYCPFKDCSALLVNEGSDREGQPITNAECPHCHRMFCAQCKVPWHAGISCEGFQQLGEDERAKDDLLLRKLAIDSKWQRCTRCRMYVEKTEGCMFMKCRCGYCFCYVCASPMSNAIHYCATCRR